MNNNSAAQRYDDLTDEITDLLQKLAADLERHGREFAASGGRDWGYPGSLGHLCELLTEAHQFMNGNQE